MQIINGLQLSRNQGHSYIEATIVWDCDLDDSNVTILLRNSSTVRGAFINDMLIGEAAVVVDGSMVRQSGSVDLAKVYRQD